MQPRCVMFTLRVVSRQAACRCWRVPALNEADERWLLQSVSNARQLLRTRHITTLH